MSIPPATAGNLPLPRWAYVPGETAEDLAALLQAKLANSLLSKADWVALGAIGRT
jgi:hypothetical protein